MRSIIYCFGGVCAAASTIVVDRGEVVPASVMVGGGGSGSDLDRLSNKI